MDVITLNGGRPLRGTIAASGSKNAALSLMAASILADETITLTDVPDVTDVNTMALVLGHVGVEAKRSVDGRMQLAHCRWHCNRRSGVGQPHARRFLCFRPFAGAARQGDGGPARRLPHRAAADRFALARAGALAPRFASKMVMLSRRRNCFAATR